MNSRTESAKHHTAPPFELVLRGYHKRQVDEHLAAVQDELQALRQQRDTLERDLGRALARTTELAAQLGQLQQRLESDAATPSTPSDATSEADPSAPPGPITDKLVRLARREAALVRANATREAAHILDAARAQAEAYRRDAEHPDRGWAGAGGQQVASPVSAPENHERTPPGHDRQRGE